MPTLAESLVSSSSRALTVRKRPDLTANRQRYQGTGYWVVKEPVGLQYFRFHDEEYFILNMLDGHVSLQQIKDGFEQRFARLGQSDTHQVGAGITQLLCCCSQDS